METRSFSQTASNGGAVEVFGAEHQDELFYGFIFDCNADDGSVLFCFNPCADSSAKPKEHNWQPGDWKYQGFEERRYYLDGTPPKKFPELACRVLARMEQGGGFDAVRTTPAFETLALDHDEQLSSARRRMNRVRKKVLAGPGKSAE